MEEIIESAQHLHDSNNLTSSFITPNGYNARIVASFNINCKDETQLIHVINLIRAQWYAAISNMAEWEYDQANELFTSKQALIGVLPLVVLHMNNDMCYVITRDFDCERETKEMTLLHKLFIHNASQKEHTGYMINDIFHVANWASYATYAQLYGYGYSQQSNQTNLIHSINDRCIKSQQEQYNPNLVLSTTQLLTELMRTNCLESAKKLSQVPYAIKIIKEPCTRSLQEMVRILATVDSVVKDPQSPIMICDGTDFAAALYLFEHITLPAYFSIQLQEPLFKDYKKVTLASTI